MKLAEAIAISRKPIPDPRGRRFVHLVCAFTPLHFATFLTAHCRVLQPFLEIDLQTGLFGDLQGNLEKAARQGATESVIALEWFDLDRRLGLREAGGWGLGVQADILSEVERSLGRLSEPLRALASMGVAVVSPPTLPVPPIGHTAGLQESAFETRLEALLAAFLNTAGAMPGVRLVNRHRLNTASPTGSRLDIKALLEAGFPYTLAHADVLAAATAGLLFPGPPKNGLITDLDDTLWSGVLGEVGVSGVTWSLATHSQQHAIYQQFLAALAEQGVLVAAASKNDLGLVKEAFERPDLLLPRSRVFPIEAHWQAKSSSVERILGAWNIAADAVVFVDDSPLERAEVEARYPDLTTLPFPRKDPDGVWRLLEQLRDLFGKPAILEEDSLRLASLRAAEEFSKPLAQGDSADEFLRHLAATVTIDYSPHSHDERAFELLNKTNQFNLNGRRYTLGEWRHHLEQTGTFVALVSYQDKFGPLGKIAVVTGTIAGEVIRVASWVMSCRAFSRRIEHHTLERLLARFGAQEAEIDFRPTERNQPLREFLEPFLPAGLEAPCRISRSAFQALCPPLPHRVVEV